MTTPDRKTSSEIAAAYTSAMFVIEQIRTGKTLSAACRLANTSSVIFMRTVSQDDTLKDLLTEAIQHGNDALADSLVELHHEESDPRILATLSKNIQWLLERRDRRFSPKIEHNHNVTADKDLIAALNRGRERVMSLPTPAKTSAPLDAEVIDATYTVIEQVDDDTDVSQFL